MRKVNHVCSRPVHLKKKTLTWKRPCESWSENHLTWTVPNPTHRGVMSLSLCRSPQHVVAHCRTDGCVTQKNKPAAENLHPVVGFNEEQFHLGRTQRRISLTLTQHLPVCCSIVIKVSQTCVIITQVEPEVCGVFLFVSFYFLPTVN